MVKQWDGYDDSSMGISVRHIKWSHLPDYVFGGEPKGSKQAVKRDKSGRAKSQIAQVNLENGDAPAKKRR